MAITTMDCPPPQGMRFCCSSSIRRCYCITLGPGLSASTPKCAPDPRAPSAPSTPMFQNPTSWQQHVCLCSRPWICSCSACTQISGTGATTTAGYPGPQSHCPQQAHVLQSPAPWLLHMYAQLRHRVTTTTGEPVPWTLELPLLYEHLCSRSQICH